MHAPSLHLATAEDELFTAVSALAHEYAATTAPDADVAADVAQDVIIECLKYHRAGTLRTDRVWLAAFIRRRVDLRLIDTRRSWWRRAATHSEHLHDRTASSHAWMHPAIDVETKELESLYLRTMKRLPIACLRAYVMVRVEGISYQATAARLAVTRAAINLHVVSAQRVFREALMDHGIAVPAPERSYVSMPPDERARWTERLLREVGNLPARDADPHQRTAASHQQRADQHRQTDDQHHRTGDAHPRPATPCVLDMRPAASDR